MEKKKTYSIVYKSRLTEIELTFKGIAVGDDIIILETGDIVKIVKENEKEKCCFISISNIGDIEFKSLYSQDIELVKLVEESNVSSKLNFWLLEKYEYYEKIREYSIKIDNLISEAKAIAEEIKAIKEKASFIDLPFRFSEE